MTILALLVGVVLGVVAYDLRHRIATSNKIANLATEQKDALEALMKLHNSTVTKNLEISDKIGSIEAMLKGRDQPQMVRKF